MDWSFQILSGSDLNFSLHIRNSVSTHRYNVIKTTNLNNMALHTQKIRFETRRTEKKTFPSLYGGPCAVYVV